MSRSDSFATLYARGVAAVRAGRMADASLWLERALALQPDQPDALVALGNLLNQQGQFGPALDRYRRALAVLPGHAGALINMGTLFHARRQYRDAVAAYDQLLGEPGQLLCLVNRALALHELGRFAEAILTLDYAHMLAPSDPEVLLARGNAQQAAQKHQAAEADYRALLALRPFDPDAKIGLARALAEQGHRNAGLEILDEVVRAAPERADAHYHAGNIQRDQGGLAEAVAAYDRALRIAPDLVLAGWNKGMCLLLAGDFAGGLPLYEWRKRLAAPVEVRICDVPLWTGREDISGRVLFLYIEQGLGDVLQFFRFVGVLEALGAKIILSCQDQLSGLLGAGRTNAVIIAADAVPRQFDFHCPLPSIPLALGMRLDSIPAQCPYLWPDVARVRHWKERIGATGFKIGVVWQGTDDARSFPLALFADIARLPDVRLISLQKGHGAEQLVALPDGMVVERLEPFDEGPQAFLDTAAIMANLDLVITPDTATAHLAGALDRPACVMLKHVPDWRWQLDRPDSPWYPALRLFRQPAIGDWAGSFRELKAYLASLV